MQMDIGIYYFSEKVGNNSKIFVKKIEHFLSYLQKQEDH